MVLTPTQMQVVEENMGLVGKVIKEKVRGLGQPGVPDYDDLFQIGCIGLIKAVMTDKGGTFSTYAYRLIWNEICDELVRNTRLVLKEQATDTIEIMSTSVQSHPNPFDILSLRYALQQAKQQAPGGAARGIQCFELIVQGYSSQEVGNMIGADSGTVRMWMTRARKYLKGFPELQHYAEVM